MTSRLPHSPSARTDNEAVREQSWQAYLAGGGSFSAAPAPDCEQMLAILAARQNLPGAWQHELPPLALTRWQRWRGLLDVGWDARNRTPLGQRFAGMTVSLLVNLFFVLFMLASLYLRFASSPEPETEAVRIRIMGFGSPSDAGGGQAAADGDLAAQGKSAADAKTASEKAAVQRQQTAAAGTAPSLTVPAMAAMNLPKMPQTSLAEPSLPAPQPLQLTTPPQPVASDFQLPPPQPTVQLRAQALPEESHLPAQPLPMPVVDLAAPNFQRQPVTAAMPAVREIPEPTPAPQIDLPRLDMPRTAPQMVVREPGQRALPALPAGQPRATPATSSEATGAQASSSAAGAASSAATNQAPSGLPGARSHSLQPGQNAAQAGVGPQQAAASSGWPNPLRGDDWGAAAQSRAGQAQGNEQGAGRGQGSGLFNADGRPRLADDRFKPRFPDPSKEGTWLRRPGMETRGTMFDGIWRPPETLLQEWVRRGVKSIRIPIPGTTLELECVISTLQATGGCLLVPGKNGVFDQPARARQAPDVPFKPELFEDPDALQKPEAKEP